MKLSLKLNLKQASIIWLINEVLIKTNVDLAISKITRQQILYDNLSDYLNI